MGRFSILLVRTIFTFLGVFGALQALADDTSGQLRAFVSVLPQKYFVERVGGEEVDVSVMVPPGRSPTTYDPSPKQMAKLAQADVFFRIGVPFEEAWIGRLREANPSMTIVDARDRIELREIDEFRGSAVQKRKPIGADHDHGGRKDPHIWTSPPLVKVLAEQIRDTLNDLAPERRSIFEANYRQFAQDLNQLDAEIRSLLKHATARRFMVLHPSWGYFADTYGLVQIPIESQGKQPGAKTLAKLIDFAREEQIPAIFVQRQFSGRDAQTIARAVGARVVTVDPLAEDYLDNMREVAKAFAGAAW